MTDVAETEPEATYRKNLIRDYDELILGLTTGYERRGATFGWWFTGEQGQLVIAALRTARDRAASGTPAVASLSYDDICLLSRSFNENHCSPHGADHRINEWLKRQIATAAPS